MKRSFFSVVVLALVLAFLYVPIILVVVYGFIPNGISMSFFDSGETDAFIRQMDERMFQMKEAHHRANGE